VATKDKLLCLEPVGFADIETKRAMKADTIFYIASMSKAPSCAAFMTLVDEGKVKVEDPVEKYFPEFKGQQVGPPPKPAPKTSGTASAPQSSPSEVTDAVSLHSPSHPITLKECMTHTAGLGDQKTQKCVSLKEDVAAYGKVPLIMEPGTKYRYSNGIDIAGGVVEVITGEKFADYLQRRILDPLGMKDTSFYPTQEQVDRLALTVKVTEDKTGIENVNLNLDHQQDPAVPNGILRQQNMRMPPTYKYHYGWPSGGLFSTAGDMMKFCQMLLNEGEYNGTRILSKDAVRMMTTNEIKGIGAYGFGLNTVDVNGKFSGSNLPGTGEKLTTFNCPDVDGLFSAGSFNHRGARSTMMWVDKKRQLVFILMLQHWLIPDEQGKRLYKTFTSTAFAKFAPKDATAH